MNDCLPLLDWVGAHPSAYVVAAGAVLATGAGIALAPWFKPASGAPRTSDWRWGLMLLAILLAGRWPSILITRELNPDESQVFAGAHALTHDPVFWRSIDGATSGPLNFFALVPAGWLVGWDSYLGVRLTALALLAVCLTLVHQSLTLAYPARSVRLATFSAAAFEALTNSVDLLHYSTELLSVTWLAGAAYAAGRRWLRGGGPAWSGLGGLLLGAVPLSKLQAAPLALSAGTWWLWAELRTSGPAATRHRSYLLTGALLPLAAFMLQVLIAGQWDNFVTSYVRFNLVYATTGDDSLASLLGRLLAKSHEEDSQLHLWLPGMMIWCAVAFRGRRIAGRPTGALALLALAATGISVFCVLRAGRPFLHYWQLVVPAVTLLLGVLLGRLATSAGGPTKTDRWLMAACALSLLGTQVWHRLRQPNFLIGMVSYLETHPRSRAAERVLAQARPGEALAVWGWANYLYVETGLRQSTQDAQIERIVTSGPLQTFFRDRFLADLMVTRPATFVDAIGPCSIYFQSPALRHDRYFPELAAVVRADYVLVDTVDEARIYRRRDLIKP